MSANQYDQSKQHRIRLSDMAEEPKRMLSPIQGFEKFDIVSLEEAIEPLMTIVPQIDQMVYTVKQNCSKPKDNLSPDESASIMLYSMEWSSRDTSFYFHLNKILRSENRQLIKPWFLYLRLFSYSFSKLPSNGKQTVYRGIKMDLSNDYPQDKIFVWWAFTSCTSSVGVLENEEFFGKTGKRTLFSIECHTGKDIRNHSNFPTEDEILLFPARQFQVMSHFNSGNEFHMIQIKEIQPPFSFISCSPQISLTLSATQSKFEDLIQQCESHSEIILNELNLTDKDMKIVIEQGIINKQCIKLSLENNKITSQGALMIAKALNNNMNLETLILLHNHISDFGVNYLSTTLSTNNTTLKTLSLGSNGITDDGVLYLAQMLKTNQSLNLLGLVYNEITDEGVRLLAGALAHNNTGLQILHLSKNKLITDGSVKSLIEMLKRNHSLMELWIQNCSFSENAKKQLRQISRSKNDFRIEL